MVNYSENNIPVLTTEDVVLFPGESFTLIVDSSKNGRVVQLAKEGGGQLVALANNSDDPKGEVDERLARIGVIGVVEDVKPAAEKLVQVTLRSLERFQVVELERTGTILLASGALLRDKMDADTETLRTLHKSLQDTAVEVLTLFPAGTERLIQQVRRIADPVALSHLAAQYMGLPRAEAQEMLEMTSIKNRLLKLLELLVVRRENLKVQSKIRETLSESIGKKQREAVLREQLKAIHDELGDTEAGPSAGDYRQKVEATGMPEAAKQVALREAGRLERMGDQSAESQVIRNYLDLLCDMPWSIVSVGAVDLEAAERVLERDHFGLEKVKRRILEHLAVMKLKPEKKGSILLFVGPPGVGKTSLGKSIAESLGRQFVRVSLGGVRDDADIRGHRRTYVGALPGRIVDGIRRAKSKDPVFVLDEVDKLGRGWGGDPASALLEVLDPEQNSTFHDHYLDVPFDLSQVLFICTANNREAIPGPLLDRMEVIEIHGYTTTEKIRIAEKHLVPDELQEHGLKAEEIEFTEAGLRAVVEGYTREAGVRSLRRAIAKICRAGAAKVATNADQRISVDTIVVHETLGPAKFEQEELDTAPVSGVVTGMAWTPVGGDVLFVEAATIPGEGKITVTGQLGDVMKESSQIAVALARVKLDGIAKTVLYKDRDIHLHVPGGAIPKDGPSAGVTMFTALVSMMLGAPIDPKIAMTGEVTLRGRVLPVGGVKEKVLAAARSGIRQVLLPSRNRRDLDDVPKEVRDTIDFRFVSHVDEVLATVFGDSGKLAYPQPVSLPDVLGEPGKVTEPHLH